MVYYSALCDTFEGCFDLESAPGQTLEGFEQDVREALTESDGGHADIFKYNSLTGNEEFLKDIEI